jgi:hypothetical protein
VGNHAVKGWVLLFVFCLIHIALTAKYITAPRAVPSPGYPLRIWHIGAHKADKLYPPCPIKSSTPRVPHNKVVKPLTKEIISRPLAI